MKIFATLDIDNDGDVTEEEFVQGCLKDEELVIIKIIIAINIITNIKNVTNITIALETNKLYERRWRLSAKTRQGHHWLYPAKRPRLEGESQGICCNHHCHCHYHYHYHHHYHCHNYYRYHYHYQHHWQYLCYLCPSNTNFPLNLHLFALLSKKSQVVFQTLQKLHNWRKNCQTLDVIIMMFFRVEKVVAANIISYTDTIKPKKKPQSAKAKRKSKKNQE